MERIAGEITDILLQKIKLNALQRVSGGSENTLVEIIARLIDMVMYYLPVDYEVEITRAERQSKASKSRNVKFSKKLDQEEINPISCSVLTFAKSGRKLFSSKVENGILMKIKSAMIIINWFNSV